MFEWRGDMRIPVNVAPDERRYRCGLTFNPHCKPALRWEFVWGLVFSWFYRGRNMWSGRKKVYDALCYVYNALWYIQNALHYV
jgi:hypothetical protein